MNGFTRRLVLTQRQKTTRKWPIIVHNSFSSHLFYLFQYYFFNINAEKLFSDIRLCVVRKISSHVHKTGSCMVPLRCCFQNFRRTPLAFFYGSSPPRARDNWMPYQHRRLKALVPTYSLCTFLILVVRRLIKRLRLETHQLISTERFSLQVFVSFSEIWLGEFDDGMNA